VGCTKCDEEVGGDNLISLVRTLYLPSCRVFLLLFQFRNCESTDRHE
jgi:hypothetical protein